jgi:aminoglycoside phosphotransferase family enzyme
MENYRKIVDAFLSGSVDGIDEKGEIPEHVETQISHVFLFPKTVYKMCKRNNVFFNEHFRDLADHKSRIDFYKADFFENRYFSPEVYLNLFGIGLSAGKVMISDDVDGCEDVVMKMQRIDLSHNLSNLLHKKSLTEKDFQLMGYEQTKAVAVYPHQPKTNESYYKIFQRGLDDLRDWMYSAPDYFVKEKTDEIIQVLRNYVEKEKDYFTNFDTKKYVVALDNHSDNIFFENGKAFFLDIYPPKEDWLTATPWMNIYRPATDILILMGEKYAKAFIRGYEDYYGSLDDKHELFYFIRSAAIQAVSLHNLSGNSKTKKEDSLLYKAYIMDNVGRLS